MLAFAIADLWTEWPVQDAALDLVVSIFAPKNLPEVARVLRPGGWLAVVYPGMDHMTELRDRFRLMRRHEPAGARYIEAVERFVGPPTIYRLRRQIVLDDAPDPQCDSDRSECSTYRCNGASRRAWINGGDARSNGIDRPQSMKNPPLHIPMGSTP